eukprot:gene6908-9542_t
MERRTNNLNNRTDEKDDDTSNVGDRNDDDDDDGASLVYADCNDDDLAWNYIVDVVWSSKGRINEEYYNDGQNDNESLISDIGDTYQPRLMPENERKCMQKYRCYTTFVSVLACAFLFALIATASKLHSSKTSKPSFNADSVITAARLLKTIDSRVDPCNDFYQFACGRWINETDIPDDKSSITTFSTLYEENLLRLRKLLEGVTPAANMKYASSYYKACMDKQRRSESSHSILHDLISSFNSRRTHEKRIAFLLLHDASPFFDVGVYADDFNSSSNAFFLSQDGLALPDPSYYLNKTIESDSNLNAYSKYIDGVLEKLGLESNSKDIIHMESRLAAVFIPRDQLRDPLALYNEFMIPSLESTFPMLAWTEVLNILYSNGRIPDRVIVTTPSYLEALLELFTGASDQQLINYMRWRLISRYVPYAGEDLLALRQKFISVRQQFSAILRSVYGIVSQPPLWRTCVAATDSAFGFELGRMFVDTYFSENAKKITEELGSFWANLRMTHSKICIFYKVFLQYALEVVQRFVLKNLNEIFKPVNRNRWSMSPPTVNAYYSPSKNEIVFPAGILQAPFFSISQPAPLNFGGIGVVIGHELSHGFDDQGRLYDARGNLRQWWTNSTRIQMEERAQCFVNQYSRYSINGEAVNGRLTLGENIADNGGLRTAYTVSWALDNPLYLPDGRELRYCYSKHAFVRWRKKHQSVLRQQALPGIDFSDDQLFFLGFAQVWCSKQRPEEAHQRLLTDVHSPNRYRVIGAVSNSADFRNAFKCSQKSEQPSCVL